MAKKYGEWVIGTEAIGEGGQAHVFLVSREGHPEDGVFALKRLKSLRGLDRFKREITTLKKLKHPGIIQVVDFDLKGAKPFFVMPYYPRRNMRHAGVLTWSIEKRLEFFAKIVQAMSAAHAAKIIHRDLKPENILVSEGDDPVITDFGICFVEDGSRFTLTEEKVGPGRYMAPEVEAGRQEDVSARTDVYLLGKLLYWLVTGKSLPREYHRRDEYELNKRGSRYELISSLLDRMVVEDPSGRFQSAGDLESHFAQALEYFRRAINYPTEKAPQLCRYCGMGEYTLVGGPATGDGSVDVRKLSTTLGINAHQQVKLRVMACPVCGNIQLFDIKSLDSPHRRTWAP